MYSLSGVFSLKQGQVFKPSSGQLTIPKYCSGTPGEWLSVHILQTEHSELKSEQRNIKFRFALYNSPLGSYKISLDNLLRERRSNDQRLDALILVIYRVARNFCGF